MSISAIIVTYNTGDKVLRCLASLQNTSGVEIIVVDNASTDGTPQLIQERFPNVLLLVQPENRGFGVANNTGVQAATSEVVVLVNPDLTLKPGALETLANFVMQYPDVGIAAPRTYETYGAVAITARPNYTPLRIAAKYLGIDRLFPTVVYGSMPDKLATSTVPLDVDWVQGSCMALRRETYMMLGGFDENFFLYMEDVDLCARAREHKLRVVYLPSAEATHEGGTTTARFPLIRVRSFHASPLYYYRKRKQDGAVQFLRLVFTLELTAKIALRTLFNLVRPLTSRVMQIQAERHVLFELWKQG